MGSVTPVTINTLNIINETTVIESITNLSRTNDSFIGRFTPLQDYKLQVIGTDDNGLNFSYISDISVKPTSISLTFGKHKYLHWLLY